MSTVAVILAAGPGKRMKSALPKVLHPVLGDPALLWVLRSLPGTVSAAVVVGHHGKEQVEAALAQWDREGLLSCRVSTVDQGEPLGTGHAVRAAAGELDRLGASNVVILHGDTPLLAPGTVAKLAASGSTLLAGHQDADEAGGTCALPWSELKPALCNGNVQGEFRLADVVAAVAGRISVAVERCEPEELMGMDSRRDQAALQAMAQERINGRWMDEGVTYLDPRTTFVGPRVVLAQDVLLEPCVRLEGAVAVGEGTRIGQGCVVRNAAVGAGVEMRPYCVVQRSEIGDGAKLGPFAHLREGSVLEERVHVGNFVETKKAILRAGAKANHLSYLGDAEVGERTNIGAGFISCNYDGFSKHRTFIGKDVFVGSDSQFVAPVSLGDGAIIGAGSTVTSDVPANALALSRAPLVVKEGGALRLREKQRSRLNRS